MATFQRGFTFMPTARVAQAIDRMRAMATSGELDLPNCWNSFWIPFLENERGDYICIDTDGVLGGPAGSVIEFIHDDSYRRVLRANFDGWLNSYVATAERGLWVIQNGSPKPRNHDDLEAAYAELNPGFPKPVFLD